MQRAIRQLLQGTARVSVGQDPLHRLAACNPHRRPSVIVAKDESGKEVGYCSYYLDDGQIGQFYIQQEFRHKGIATEMLKQCTADLKANGLTEVWGVTPNKKFMNMKAFAGRIIQRMPAHPDVTGDGYYMKL